MQRMFIILLSSISLVSVYNTGINAMSAQPNSVSLKWSTIPQFNRVQSISSSMNPLTGSTEMLVLTRGDTRYDDDEYSNGYRQSAVYRLADGYTPFSERSMFRRVRFDYRQRRQRYNEQYDGYSGGARSRGPSQVAVGPLESWALFNTNGQVFFKRTINPVHKSSNWCIEESPIRRPGGRFKLLLSLKHAYLLATTSTRTRLYRLALSHRRGRWHRVRLQGNLLVSSLAMGPAGNILMVSDRDGLLYTLNTGNDNISTVSVPDGVAVGEVAINGNTIYITDRNGVLYTAVLNGNDYSRLQWQRVDGVKHLRSIQAMADGSLVGVDTFGQLVFGKK